MIWLMFRQVGAELSACMIWENVIRLDLYCYADPAQHLIEAG